jgi:hypothetical protein
VRLCLYTVEGLRGYCLGSGCYSPIDPVKQAQGAAFSMAGRWGDGAKEQEEGPAPGAYMSCQQVSCFADSLMHKHTVWGLMRLWLYTVEGLRGWLPWPWLLQRVILMEQAQAFAFSRALRSALGALG